MAPLIARQGPEDAAGGATQLSGSSFGLFGRLGFLFGFRLFRLRLVLGLAALLAALRDGVVDRPDHVEGLLLTVVVFAVENLGEAPNRVFQLHVLARLA